MANTLHDTDHCYRVMLRSCRVFGQPIDYRKFVDNLQPVIETKITTYAEYLLAKMSKVANIWNILLPQHRELTANAIATVTERIKLDRGVAGWPMTDAIYIWPWLHVIAIHLDLNAGHAERVSYLRFIPNLIACSSCRQHYRQHSAQVIESLQLTTCANALLALHTYVNSTRGIEDEEVDATTGVIKRKQKQQYVYNSDLVNVYFYEKYRREYFLLTTYYDKSLIKYI